MSASSEQAAALAREWESEPRWAGIRRDYTAEQVIRLRGSVVGQQQWLAPIVADAEASFSGTLNAFELMKSLIKAGGAGVLFEDQLSPQKCGHLGEKVLIPTGQQVKALTAARLAADVLGARSLIIARTHAQEASLLTSDADERDHEFLTGERTADGFYRVQPGLYACVTRGLAFAPYADLLWLETSTPNLAEARAFATIIHSQYPDQLLAYSCAPSFNWQEHLDDASIAQFQTELAAMGYRFQLTSQTGVQAMNETMLRLAHGHSPDDLQGDVHLQGATLRLEPFGCTTPRNQREAGASYLDLVTQAIAPGTETVALAG